MEENRHSPERLGQITPNRGGGGRKKKKFQQSLSHVGELFFGGAAGRLLCAPLKHPSPTTELVPCCKGPGLMPQPWSDPVDILGSVCLGHFWAEKSHQVWGHPSPPCPQGSVWVANTSGKIYDLEE